MAAPVPPWALGAGIGAAVLLLVFAAKGVSDTNTRYVDFKSKEGKRTTIRIKKLQDGIFEAASWGEGVSFTQIPPAAPLATYTFVKGAAINAQGNANTIAFLHKSLPDISVTNLFNQEGSEVCAKPGCEAPQK